MCHTEESKLAKIGRMYKGGKQDNLIVGFGLNRRLSETQKCRNNLRLTANTRMPVLM